MAMVAGLIPILSTAVQATTDYNGRTMWFGFLVIRLVTLYIAMMPWSKVDMDFQCDLNSSVFCRKSCFNKHFNAPVVTLWNFTFILFIISVMLMELFASQLRYNIIKAKLEKEAIGQSISDINLTAVKDHELAQKDIMIDFHQQKAMLLLYLACILLRLLVEIAFLYVLMMWHLPKVDGKPIYCSTWLCPGQHNCILRAAVEKRMSVYMLCTLSAAIICCCVVFGLYIIYHYLIQDRRRSSRYKATVRQNHDSPPPDR